MFTHLRKTAQSFFMRCILFLLVGMFVFWGIGDVFRGMGAGPSSIATVAKTPITIQKFQRAVQNAHGQQQPMDVLNRMITTLMLEKEEAALGIIVNDDTVANFLGAIPQFHDKNGQFDKSLYQDMIAKSGRDEAEFVENVRRDIAQKLLLDSLTHDIQVPQEMVLAQYKSQEEKRSAGIILVTPAAVNPAALKPSEQEIKAYYDAHTKDYTAPEVRTVSYVALPITDVLKKVEVPEEEIKRTYEERKDDFRTPETRQVDDMEFDNEQDAKDASAKLAKGVSFAKVLATAPIANKGKISLGFVTSRQLPGDAAGAVTALKEDGVTEPIMANFRYHIYHVTKIEAGRAQTFDEARADISKEIASRDAQETGQKLMNGIEDALAGGATLEQAAEKIGEKVQTVGPVTRQGMLANGNKATLPLYDNFLATAFSTAEKDHSQSVQAADGSYFLVRVDSVSPEHVKALSEVKAEVSDAALAEKVHAKLEKFAQDAATSLRAGKKAEGLPQAIPVSDLKRKSGSVPDGPLEGKVLPGGLLGELFRIHVNETTHAYPLEDGNYIIATLGGITPAPQKPDPKVLQDISKDLKETLTDELMQHYITYLRSKYPVTFDKQALSLLNGEGALGGEQGGGGDVGE